VSNPIVGIYNFTNTNLHDKLLEGLNDIRFKRIIKPSDTVLIKPNLTWTHHKKGVTTTPKFLDNLTRILRPHCSELIIGESDGANHAWTAEEAFKGHCLYEIAEKNDLKLINLTHKPRTIKKTEIAGESISLELSKYLLEEVDVLITVPVLKVHAATIVSLGLKNLWGCIPNPMRLLYHPFLHKGIVAINKLYNPQISIIDATYGLNNSGPIYGTPVKLNKFFISNNLVALDMMACSYMGIPFENVKHIYLAQQKFLSREEYKNWRSIGNFQGNFKFVLNKTLMDRISYFIMFHRYINNLFYKSKLSGFFQLFSEFYKRLIKKEIPSGY
jgi:uncharacterized protein (DUF362 family)